MLSRSLALSLLLACSVTGAASAQTWRMTDLGTLGGPHSSANAINNKGDVVGTSRLEGDKISHAVLWSKDKMIDLGTLGDYPSSEAIGISDAGNIVGEAWVPYAAMEKKRAITWNANKASVLGIANADLPGGAAYRVNDVGLAVGRAFLKDPGTRSGARATLLDKGQVSLVPAFDLPGNAGRVTPEVAMAVNKGGTVVGAARAMLGDKALRRPFLYKGGVTIDPVFEFDHVNPIWANDVNDAGDVLLVRVTGRTEVDIRGTFQSLIVKNGKVTEVPMIEGLSNGELRAINARGDAVGYGWNKTGGTVPMIYTKGVSLDANKVLAAPTEWKIVLLTDINDAGQITGVASKGDETHAVRLDPVGNGQVALNGDPDAPVLIKAEWKTAFAGARPNPVTSSMGAQFAFTLAQPGDVTITLTNVQGRNVRTLRGGFEAGPSTLVWDGRDDNGSRMGSGVYFARFVGLGTAATRKVVIAE